MASVHNHYGIGRIGRGEQARITDRTIGMDEAIRIASRSFVRMVRGAKGLELMYGAGRNHVGMRFIGPDKFVLIEYRCE